jgi:nodulation protein E
MEAVAQSGLQVPFADGNRASAIFGCGSPGITTLEEAYHDLFKLDKRRANPLTLLKSLGSTAPATVSMKCQITGPVFTVVSACSSAPHAMGLTFRMIRDGSIDLGITGGTEASLNWGTQRAWEALFVLSPDGCFPFSKKRNGTVLSEGGGMFVFEELEHARERGATILAEVMGFGMTADAGDMVNPKVEGPSAAMREALGEAGLQPSDIDYLNAHGTATRVNDINETRAIKEVFGKHAYDLSVSSTKSMHGHLLGGGGAVEAVASIMALRDQFVPPTINLDVPCDECDLDYTANVGRERKIRYVMSNSLAFGGLNTVLVFGPPPA